MANEAREQNQSVNPETAEASAACVDAARGSRRPYAAPRLTRLGAVRDLTFGAAGSPVEDLTHRANTPGGHRAVPR